MLSKIAKVLQPARKTLKPQYSFSTIKNDGKETEQQQNDSQQENFDQATGSKGARSAQPDQENEKIQNKKEQINYGWQAWRVFVWGNLSLLAYNIYNLNTDEKPQDSPAAIGPYFSAAKYINDSYHESIDFFTKPPTKKLLQEIPFLPPGMDPPKTLVLNLSGTLIHSNYIFGKGTEVMKRPGLQKFLRTLSQQYEIVVFSDDETMFTMDLVEKLDQTHSIFSGRFGRESMVYEGGQYIKDLNYLNRDLNSIIVVELNPDKLKYHSDNAIYLPKFEGDTEDNELLKLLPFLQHLGRPEIRDVRKEISYYGNYNPSDKYLEELRQKHQEMKKKQSSGIQGLFGGQQQQKNFGQFNRNY